MRYFCDIRPGHYGPRYEYVVLDKERDQKFGIGFEVPPGAAEFSRVDVRQSYASACEIDLWVAIKKASPGTYLEAKALGWLPWPPENESDGERG